MQTIGLLGGMSWESTELYYRSMNELVKNALGGLHSAEIVLVSLDLGPLAELQHRGDWPAAGEHLARAALRAQAAGAEFLLICSNTMHEVAPRVEAAIDIPLLHIADATAAGVKSAGVRKVGLLGTRFTMEQDFYRGRLEREHGLEVIVPNDADRALVHRVIYDELCLGRIEDASRREFLRIIEDLRSRGAEGVIEGCTEVVLLVRPEHTEVPLFDSGFLHARAAVERALG